MPENALICKNITGMLQGMPDGSLLLYNDSRAYSFYSFFNGRVNAAKNFEELLDVDREFKVSSPDFGGIIEEYIDKFDFRPKLTSNAVAKLLRRIG